MYLDRMEGGGACPGKVPELLRNPEIHVLGKGKGGSEYVLALSWEVPGILGYLDSGREEEGVCPRMILGCV